MRNVEEYLWEFARAFFSGHESLLGNLNEEVVKSTQLEIAGRFFGGYMNVIRITKDHTTYE